MPGRATNMPRRTRMTDFTEASLKATLQKLLDDGKVARVGRNGMYIELWFYGRRLAFENNKGVQREALQRDYI